MPSEAFLIISLGRMLGPALKLCIFIIIFSKGAI